MSTDCYQTELYGLAQPLVLQFCDESLVHLCSRGFSPDFIPVGASGTFLKTECIQGPKRLQPAHAPNYWCCEEREEFSFFLAAPDQQDQFFGGLNIA